MEIVIEIIAKGFLLDMIGLAVVFLHFWKTYIPNKTLVDEMWQLITAYRVIELTLFFNNLFQIVKNPLLFLLEILEKKIMLPMVERFFCNNDNSNTLTY